MSKFIFVYHGGKTPSDPAEQDRVMAAWGAWMGSLGDALVDGGAPVGLSKTVSSAGVADDGGSNPVSGYSMVEAADQTAAVTMAQGCPILDAGGSVEVAEIHQM